MEHLNCSHGIFYNWNEQIFVITFDFSRARVLYELLRCDEPPVNLST